MIYLYSENVQSSGHLNEMMPWIAAIIAIIITSVVNLYILKKQLNNSVLSGNRQAWINELREMVSQYLSITGTFGFINSKIINEGIKFDESEDERSQKLRQIKTKIELLLNPFDSESKLLVIKLNDLRILAYKDIVKNGKYLIDFRACHDEIIKITQGILRKEWERVKKGK